MQTIIEAQLNKVYVFSETEKLVRGQDVLAILMCYCWFFSYNNVTLMVDFDSKRGSACVQAGYGNSVLPFQLCCEPKIILKNSL